MNRELIRDVLTIKNKLSTEHIIRESIFLRHNIISFKNNDFKFKPTKIQFAKTSWILILSIFSGALFLLTQGHIGLGFFILFISLFCSLTRLLYPEFKNDNSLLLEHDDYKDLSKAITKKELKTLIQYYTISGQESFEKNDDYNNPAFDSNGHYQPNLFDLYGSLDLLDEEENPELYKMIKEEQFNNFLDKVYETEDLLNK